MFSILFCSVPFRFDPIRSIPFNKHSFLLFFCYEWNDVNCKLLCIQPRIDMFVIRYIKNRYIFITSEKKSRLLTWQHHLLYVSSACNLIPLRILHGNFKYVKKCCRIESSNSFTYIDKNHFLFYCLYKILLR